MGATLVDVARQSGVSTTTVSRVLNNKMVMPISLSTIERIKQTVGEMGYYPNASARALAIRRTYTIALFSTEMTDPQFAQMLEAVQAKVRELGYHLVVCNELDSVLKESRVDGVLLLSSPNDPCFSSVLKSQIAVFVNSGPQLLPNCVGWSDIEGTYEVGQYLLRMGHCKIAALFGDIPSYAEPQHSKVIGFRRAMQEAGIKCLEWFGSLEPGQFENGYLLTKKHFPHAEGITAIFARNDFLALGAMKALGEMGVLVPQDISVVGYADLMFALFATPALTSVRTPIAEAGKIAVERLIQAIENKKTSFPGLMLKTKLVVRDSCAPPRK